MYLEQIRSITNWDYCISEQVEEDEALYQFGFKDGIHFYLSEYFFEDSLGRWLFSAWKDKKQLVTIPIHEFKEIITEIKEILNDDI